MNPVKKRKKSRQKQGYSSKYRRRKKTKKAIARKTRRNKDIANRSTKVLTFLILLSFLIIFIPTQSAASSEDQLKILVIYDSEIEKDGVSAVYTDPYYQALNWLDATHIAYDKLDSNTTEITPELLHGYQAIFINYYRSQSYIHTDLSTSEKTYLINEAENNGTHIYGQGDAKYEILWGADTNSRSGTDKPNITYFNENGDAVFTHYTDHGAFFYHYGLKNDADVHMAMENNKSKAIMWTYKNRTFILQNQNVHFTNIVLSRMAVHEGIPFIPLFYSFDIDDFSGYTGFGDTFEEDDLIELIDSTKTNEFVINVPTWPDRVLDWVWPIYKENQTVLLPSFHELPETDASDHSLFSKAHAKEIWEKGIELMQENNTDIPPSGLKYWVCPVGKWNTNWTELLSGMGVEFFVSNWAGHYDEWHDGIYISNREIITGFSGASKQETLEGFNNTYGRDFNWSNYQHHGLVCVLGGKPSVKNLPIMYHQPIVNDTQLSSMNEFFRQWMNWVGGYYSTYPYKALSYTHSSLSIKFYDTNIQIYTNRTISGLPIIISDLASAVLDGEKELITYDDAKNILILPILDQGWHNITITSGSWSSTKEQVDMDYLTSILIDDVYRQNDKTYLKLWGAGAFNITIKNTNCIFYTTNNIKTDNKFMIWNRIEYETLMKVDSPDANTIIKINSWDLSKKDSYSAITVSFTADSTDGNNVVFTIINLTPSRYYKVFRDNKEFKRMQADTIGSITFSDADWSYHDYDVRLYETSVEQLVKIINSFVYVIIASIFIFLIIGAAEMARRR